MGFEPMMVISHTRFPIVRHRPLGHPSKKVESLTRGGKGIRTLVTVNRKRDFESRAFDHSAIPPKGDIMISDFQRTF